MLGTPRSRLSAGSGRLKRRLRAELPALQGDATQIDPLPEFAFVNPAGLAGLHAACLRSGPLFGVAAENCRRCNCFATLRAGDRQPPPTSPRPVSSRPFSRLSYRRADAEACAARA